MAARKTMHLARPMSTSAEDVARFAVGVWSSDAACGTEWLPDSRLTDDVNKVDCKRCQRSSWAREAAPKEGTDT